MEHIPEPKEIDELVVKVIGTGGIGLSIIEDLTRTLMYGNHEFFIAEPQLHLIDGDEFEEKNKARQGFATVSEKDGKFTAQYHRGNKAEVTANKLKAEFPFVNFHVHPTYLDEGNIASHISDGDYIFMCVDNHQTRKLVSEYCDNELDNFILISGGNNYEDGNVQVFYRKDGKDITLPIHAEIDQSGRIYHPEIANPTDKHPNEIEEHVGCLEMVQSAPQLLLANRTAGTFMLNSFYSILKGNFDKDDILNIFKFDDAHFDIRKPTVLSNNEIERKSRERASKLQEDLNLAKSLLSEEQIQEYYRLRQIREQEQS